MMGDKTPEQFETWAKDKFINRPGEMKLLIVVDKLLTGFDAPSATYLYLDRKMIDHTLFQAICRVNRVNGDQKEFGYIVDYRCRRYKRAFRECHKASCCHLQAQRGQCLGKAEIGC